MLQTDDVFDRYHGNQLPPSCYRRRESNHAPPYTSSATAILQRHRLRPQHITYLTRRRPSCNVTINAKPHPLLLQRTHTHALSNTVAIIKYIFITYHFYFTRTTHFSHGPVTWDGMCLGKLTYLFITITATAATSNS